MRNRFIIVDKGTGSWVSSVFAERFDPYGSDGGHFFVGDEIIASADLNTHEVSVSGTVYENL